MAPTRWILSTTAVGLVLGAYGQGQVQFNNYTYTTALAPVTIATAPGASNPADGPPGAFVGSNYSASLYFVSGTVSSQAAFDSLNPIWCADVLFFGTTGTGPGHGYGGDVSGFFDGGDVRLVGQSRTDYNVTVQVWAWFNGGGVYSSYAQARVAGHNVGQSNLLPLYAAPPPSIVANMDGLQPFTVGIPEPSTIMLAVLGGAALLLVRRRR